MFGLSIKEQLYRLIATSCKNAIIDFETNIETFYLKYCDLNDDELLSSKYQEAVKQYFDAVSVDVISKIQNGPRNISIRLTLALQSPELCGYPDIDLTKGLTAGSLYALCYYAHKNHPAKPKDCVSLNHFQNSLINSALKKLDDKLSGISF